MEKAILFVPGEDGKVIEQPVGYKAVQALVDGTFEYGANLYTGVPEDVDIYVNESGIIDGLPYNRGFHGSFVIGRESVGLTDNEIRQILSVVNNHIGYELNSHRLQHFFEEKDLPVEIFMYDVPGMVIQLTNHDIIRAIGQTTAKEKLAIANNLRKLDYKNGDINDYLKYLGKALANNMHDNIQID